MQKTLTRVSAAALASMLMAATAIAAGGDKSAAHNHGHDHGHQMTDAEKKIYQGYFEDAQVKPRPLTDWDMLNGSAAPPPQSPVTSTAPLQPLTLIPYGAAKLRITAFPVLASR